MCLGREMLQVEVERGGFGTGDDEETEGDEECKGFEDQECKETCVGAVIRADLDQARAQGKSRGSAQHGGMTEDERAAILMIQYHDKKRRGRMCFDAASN
jgi:hypothetical protein